MSCFRVGSVQILIIVIIDVIREFRDSFKKGKIHLVHFIQYVFEISHLAF